MFNKIFKYESAIQRHLNAPLLKERIEYLQSWVDRRKTKNKIELTAQYLLRIVEFLNLKSTKRIITISEIMSAANKWDHYQTAHNKKRNKNSSLSKYRFIWYTLDWLNKMHIRERLPEEEVDLFNKIFKQKPALKRHIESPLLNERLVYLKNLEENGAPIGFLWGAAAYLLIVIKYLKLNKLRMITNAEIKKAAKRWSCCKVYTRRKRKLTYSESANDKFSHVAKTWLSMFGFYKNEEPKIPFSKYLYSYVKYMRNEQGLSENTIESKFLNLKYFLIDIYKKRKLFKKILPIDIDNILINKHDIDGYCRRSVQTYAGMIRVFIRYCENKKWCRQNLSCSIKAPRVYKNESLPYSPSWNDVKKILVDSNTNHPTDIRDRAVLMLLTVYGIRSSEVSNLKLDDIDWKNERIYLKRAKRAKPQVFPLSKTVGDAILRYIKEVRPNQCDLKEIFLCRKAPHRIISKYAIYLMVSKRLRPLNPGIKHFGPHALRHACATHLINTGFTLKEISDHLGHTVLSTTQIYAKVDIVNLRKVSEFSLRDIL